MLELLAALAVAAAHEAEAAGHSAVLLMRLPSAIGSMAPVGMKLVKMQTEHPLRTLAELEPVPEKQKSAVLLVVPPSLAEVLPSPLVETVLRLSQSS